MGFRCQFLLELLKVARGILCGSACVCMCASVCICGWHCVALECFKVMSPLELMHINTQCWAFTSNDCKVGKDLGRALRACSIFSLTTMHLRNAFYACLQSGFTLQLACGSFSGNTVLWHMERESINRSMLLWMYSFHFNKGEDIQDHTHSSWNTGQYFLVWTHGGGATAQSF
jgi:hypothetical protein